MENSEKRKEFQIKMGDYEVYESGSVTSVKAEPIEFVFSGFSVKIFFEFVENVSKQNMLLDIKDDVLKIRLINFNNPLGTENISPIKVGTLDGKQLFFQFRVYAMDGNGQNNKLLNYTWLLKENTIANE